MDISKVKIVYAWVGSILKAMPTTGRTSTLTRHFLNGQLRIAKYKEDIENLYKLYGGTILKITIHDVTPESEFDQKPKDPVVDVNIQITGIAPCGTQNRGMIVSEREKHAIVPLGEYAFARSKDYYDEELCMLMVNSNGISVKTSLPFDEYTAEIFQKYIA